MPRSSPLVPWIAALGAALLPAPSAAAQTAVAVDLTYVPTFAWRGATRAEAPTFHPALRVRRDVAAGTVSAGAWAAVETRSRRGEITTAGDHRLGEIDAWAQYTRRLLAVDATLGAIHYAFTGDEDTGGRGRGDSTTELYLQLQPAPGRLPGDPRLALYWDVDETHGLYLEGAVTRSLSLLPLPTGPAALVLGATGGYSLAAPGGVERPWEGFAGESFTHADASAALVFPFPPVLAHVTAHRQWNLDLATERVALDRGDAHRVWIEIGGSYALRRGRRMP